MPVNLSFTRTFFRKITPAIAALILISACRHKTAGVSREDLTSARKEFNQHAANTNSALQKYIPDSISSITNQQYDKDAKLDIYFPSAVEHSDKTLPTIVWIHGGGWISGDKSYIANYCKILAGKGYTTVSINYSLAPGSHYPTPVRQANTALAYLAENAGRFHVDSAHFILAGSSAGASIAAQLANAISNSGYAKQLNIAPAIRRAQLSAAILYGGPYNLAEDDLGKAYSNALKKFLRAYTGTPNFLGESEFASFSVANQVTSTFPPAFISAGNGDDLLPSSQKLARALSAACVHVDTLFFPADHKPAAPHDYQFNLDNEDGNIALARSILFLANQRMTRNK